MANIESLLNVKSALKDMEIGDIIACRYTAVTNGSIGYLSELGTCKADEINPSISHSTPDGKFYFVKVDEDKFIADRNIQCGISHSEINKDEYFDGRGTRTSFLMNGVSSYIAVPIEQLKITNQMTTVVKVWKENWGKGNNEERIVSCTQSGGFSMVYCNGSGNPFIEVALAFSATIYTTVKLPIDSSRKGWLTFYCSFDGNTIIVGCKELDKRASLEKNGTIVRGSASYIMLGAEAGYGLLIESSLGLFKGKFKEFQYWNAGYNSIASQIDNPDKTHEKLLCLINSKNASYSKAHDVAKTKSHGIINNCSFDYEDDDKIFTIPTGGVAYLEIEREKNLVFPIEPMTSASSSIAVVTSSSNYSGRMDYRAFDKRNVADSSDSHWMGDGETAWLQVGFKNGPLTTDFIDIYNKNSESFHYSFGYVTILGSNDGTNYEIVVEKSPNQNPGASGLSRFILNKPVSYNYYKFIFDSTSGYVGVEEIEFYKFNGTYKTIPSLTHKNLGGWPESNDWDKYIWKNNLNEKITPSDNNVWNYADMMTLCKDRVMFGIKTPIDGASYPSQAANGLFSKRGYSKDAINDSSAKRYSVEYPGDVKTINGFRPMLITKVGE